MCQPKSEGGKRCAAHTRPAYDAAMLEVKGSTDAERVSLADTHRQAFIDHACTPSGAKELLSARALFEETFHVFPSTSTQQEKDRQSLMATLALVQVQAEIRASVEEQVRREARHARTGSHAEAPMTECAPVTVETPALASEPVAAAYEEAMLDVKGGTDAERVARVDRHRQALLDHACTPSGAKDLTEAHALFEETFRVFPSTNPQQEHDRQSLLATLDSVKAQAENRASVEERVSVQQVPTAPDTTDYERVDTTARHLQAGDVLSGSGFVVTHKPYTATRLRSGRLYVEGFYPGKPVRRHEWNSSTTMAALRAPRPTSA